ncbi:macrophage mannose receptor 1-like [Hemibagrus wyckioides]|uniref:macrophage mannose receptor 1-like n=1 Tax=Hemibagrus wyckioides TaxID=337641 RepID=UPI00266C8ECF|nr:macrophage mannose receptor 1-like [Hemibagrus wyckioides]XP_058250084.1 macrophage mannose receptor 1-like [Hemibagrus wyckioides]
MQPGRNTTKHQTPAEMKMKKSSLLSFLLLCGTALGQRREYVYMGTKMTWSAAQRFCRENYVDLATITSDDENLRTMQTANSYTSEYKVWIGLNRSAPLSDVWQWSDGDTSGYFKWSVGQPDNWNNCENCVRTEVGGWNDANCETPSTFFCSWRFVLVKENKTWGEALNYCRTHYTGLAIPVSPKQLTLAESVTTQTQTVNIWTGLRFMDGQWLSVSKNPLGSLVSLMPSCPAQRYRCGARNTITHLWENRRCDEKLNFLCY